jgi:hypothetical protein
MRFPDSVSQTNDSYCCRHKRKVQNFLPCKTSPQNNCDGPTAAGGIYEDLHDVIPRPTPTHHHPAGGHIVAPSIEVCMNFINTPLLHKINVPTVM